MKCEACQHMLEEYFDGELTVRRADEVSAHLAGCAVCAAELAGLQQEHEIYTRYERGIEVTPALWAGIEARLKVEKAAVLVSSSASRWRAWLTGLFAAPHISPAFAAALVVLAIGVTVAVMSYLHSRNPGNGGNSSIAINGGNTNTSATPTTAPQPGRDGSTGPIIEKPDNQNRANDDKQVKESKPAPQRELQARSLKPPAPPDPMKLVREAEQKYLAAIAIMAQDVNHRRSQIDPLVLARFDSALADIDRTIQETRQIVRRNPDDPVALQYLLGAYAKKVDTLRAMTLD